LRGREKKDVRERKTMSVCERGRVLMGRRKMTNVGVGKK
jgi:hypothetical protein